MKNLKDLKTLLSKNKALFSPGLLDAIALVFSCLLYGSLVFTTISTASIWFDEAYSAYIIRFNVFEIAQYTATDVHPPMYYWLLHFWSQLFGTTELAVRSLSAVFGILVVVFGFFITKKLFGRRAAWIAALLLALSPMLIRFGQEARMYTMVAAIALAATLVLMKATKNNKWTAWVSYGLLLALGMWTNYFVALVWVGHWVWRFIVIWTDGGRGLQLVKKYFTRQWLGAHVVSIVLFLPWVPSLISQLLEAQQGFWVDPVSAETPINYLADFFLYQTSDEVRSWFAVWLFVLVATLVALGVKTFQSIEKQKRMNLYLIVVLAFVPPFLLFLASLPPLKPAFVDRYLMTSVAVASILVAVFIAVGASKLKKATAAFILLLFVAASFYGISNVNYYGNYNKHSNTSARTRQLIEFIREKATPGEPIIAESPTIFYEGAFYDNADNPIYFLESSTNNYEYGSYDMLKPDSASKITDIDDFLQKHPSFWYFGNDPASVITEPKTLAGLKRLESISVSDPLDHKSVHKASHFGAKLSNE